jgi:hypothetical protein
MAESSSMDQLSIEKQLFSKFHSPESKRVRGEGYFSPHHQKILSSQRKTMINQYLALYHTSSEFITTPEALENEIVRNFQDNLQGFEGSRPQSYASILHDVERGTVGNVFDGYTSLMNKDKENELYNAIIGTVAQGKPGYNEVIREIEEAFENSAEVEKDQSKSEEASETTNGNGIAQTNIDAQGESASVARVAADGTTDNAGVDDLVSGDTKQFVSEDIGKKGLRPVLDARGKPSRYPDGEPIYNPDQVHALYSNPEVNEFILERAQQKEAKRKETEEKREVQLAQEALELEKLRERYYLFNFLPDDSYRNGYRDTQLYQTITTTFDPDDSSKLHFPSDEGETISPPEEPLSIVAQAVSNQEATDPQSISRRQILGTDSM